MVRWLHPTDIDTEVSIVDGYSYIAIAYSSEARTVYWTNVTTWSSPAFTLIAQRETLWGKESIMDFKEYDANDIGTDRMYQSINNDLNWDELDEPHKDRYATVFGEHDGMLHTIDTFVRRVEKRNEGGFTGL